MLLLERPVLRTPFTLKVVGEHRLRVKHLRIRGVSPGHRVVFDHAEQVCAVFRVLDSQEIEEAGTRRPRENGFCFDSALAVAFAVGLFRERIVVGLLACALRATCVQ